LSCVQAALEVKQIDKLSSLLHVFKLPLATNLKVNGKKYFFVFLNEGMRISQNFPTNDCKMKKTDLLFNW
jgi:hypothetical protein